MVGTSLPPATRAPAIPGEAEIRAQVEALRRAFAHGRSRPLEWRRRQLRRLIALLDENAGRLCDSLALDMGKPPFEVFGSEIGFVKQEARHALSHLRRWTRPERAGTPLLLFPARGRVVREPLGVVLVVAPWNYPIQLLLGPLVGVLAAGNCALLKPSEIAPESAALLAELVPRYLDPACVAVAQGGVPETQALLAERFDHVFFTGSTRVGRIVYEAAARHLTPVTLELGGKSPCIVLGSARLTLAARRIGWGKCFNAGQSCVAPDYVLVERALEAPLLDALKAAIRELYGEDPRLSPDYARIVSDRHHERLVALLSDGRVAAGGEHDRASRYLAPTLLTEVPEDAPVMGEEIFGPILPVVPVDGPDAAIAYVNARPKPLALYVFGEEPRVCARILAETAAGGVCINDTISHVIPPSLPFGGVGASGFGAYHGRYGFETFSHRKGVLDRGTWLDPRLRYPPYGKAMAWVKRLWG